MLGFLFVALAGHALRPAGAGSFFEAIALFTMLATICSLGAGVGFQRLMPIYRTDRPRDLTRLALIGSLPALLFAAIAGVLMFVGSHAIADTIIHHGNRAAAAASLRLLAPYLPGATLMSILVPGFAAWSVARSSVILNVMVPTLRLVLFGVIAAVGITVARVSVAWGVPTAVAFLVVAWMIGRALREHPQKDDDLRRSVRTIGAEFWRFAGLRGLAGICAVLVLWLDVVLVGTLSSSRTAAGYAIASRFVVLGLVGLNAVGFAVAPLA